MPELHIDPRYATWRRPRRCEAQHCVEVAISNDRVLVRSSHLPAGPVLHNTPQQWSYLLDAVCSGNPTPEQAAARLAVVDVVDDGVYWRGDDGAALPFDWDEWAAFIKSAQAGEFDLPEVTA
jgi:hypothetical protein